MPQNKGRERHSFTEDRDIPTNGRKKKRDFPRRERILPLKGNSKRGYHVGFEF